MWGRGVNAGWDTYKCYSWTSSLNRNIKFQVGLQNSGEWTPKAVYLGSKVWQKNCPQLCSGSPLRVRSVNAKQICKKTIHTDYWILFWMFDWMNIHSSNNNRRKYEYETEYRPKVKCKPKVKWSSSSVVYWKEKREVRKKEVDERR